MKIETLQELYVKELRDLYDAENQLLKALPKMADAASSDELRAAFEEHLDITQGQVERLNTIFTELGAKAKGAKCPAMKGLIEEANELIGEDAEPEVLDAGLICAAQKVEHYEIASYGCVRTFAELLGHTDQADMLQESLDEEREADENLTELAMSCINLEAAEVEEGVEAAAAEEEEEEEEGPKDIKDEKTEDRANRLKSFPPSN